MDRNSITGIILITIILGFFWWMNKPTEEQLRQIERQRDSLRKVELAKLEAEQAKDVAQAEEKDTVIAEIKDSTKLHDELIQRYGLFADASKGTNEFITLENKELKVTFSTKGGRIYSVELKNYKTFDQKPLIMFSGDQNRFGFTFTYNNRVFHTNDLYFTPKQNGNKIDFIINAGNEGSLAFSYELPEDGYMIKYAIESKNLDKIITTRRGGLEMEWKVEVPAQEKSPSFERRYAGVYYKYYQDEVDHINAKTTDEDIVTKIKWIAYKDQFFSSAFIADEYFLNGAVKVEAPKDEERVIMTATSYLSIPFEGTKTTTFSFYFGPNDFKILKAYKDIDLQKLVYLGWGFLRYINLGVIEVFHFLEKYINNYGIIILLLTIFIKLLLFPLTYKSYMSTAKMRVLKPQVDAIYEKIPKEKAMERQQAVMALYRKAGVSQLGGCLPMLLQMPILFAMFQFFPASIELRQKSFLWAHDLSSYDSILDLGFNIPFYGDHVSLFVLLMTATNLIYTHINQQMTQTSQQMPGMKGMMYMMPIMFLFFFNNYAAGLSYYYFISTLITIGQTLLIRSFVDEKALLAKLEANKKKPKKKSKFQQRLEEMQKQQQQQAKKRR
ncbi:MAG: membrane protein insertase YidC [Chlorobi bacterium]|nr:membrane protein insertase YidC [Chlorobiota bacterium]